MKEYAPDHLRNSSLVGHGGAGKTSLAEAMLFSAGTITRLGKVEEGNTASDYHPDEIDRQISINTSLLFCEWKGYKVNILDTPGYTDFTGEVKSSLRVTDTAVILLKAVEGVEVGTEIVAKYAEDYRNGVEVGVDEVRAELLPEDKVRAIEDLRTRYGAVAMIGDGINDAPALAAADVGIVMGAAGSHAAMETADIALMADELLKVPFAIRLNRRALSVIKAYVAFAVSIKLVFFSLAVAGHATLWMAVVADTGASLVVVANALRLLRAK